MVSVSLFTLFLFTSFVNIITPGLGFVTIMGLSLQRGWCETIWACVGLALGIAILQVVSLSGMGVIVAKSPDLYAAIKFAGAFFLFFLAWRAWKNSDEARIKVTVARGGRKDTFFLKCIIVSITNPQPLVFTISVFPQFISVDLPFIPQVALMVASYAAMVVSGGVFYAVLASRARRFFQGEQGTRTINRAVAVVFFAIGLVVFALAAKPYL